jgi:predicted RNase H-like HicB family nuclease
VAKKDSNIQKKNFPYEFPIELETRAQGHVVARCSLLPGCQAEGKTAKEAMEKLKNSIDLYFSSAAPAYFETSEDFPKIPTIYALAEFRGRFYAATGRDQVLVSPSGAPGSWKVAHVTHSDSKFFTPDPRNPEEAGDYATQIYCLCTFGMPGQEKVLFAGTNLNGAVYYTVDGENWKEAFSTGEDRVHTLCEFENRLYAGTSSNGKVFAFDGLQWNTVGDLSEAAVTAMGVYNGHLYVGTYPSGIIFRTEDGLIWEEITSTGQNFIQSFKEFNGAFYVGTSGPKGVIIYRTENGKDWLPVYESTREVNLYCLEVFENTLLAGTGNAGRILKSRDGRHWTTAYTGDAEGVRAFGVFNDYLYAGTDNGGSILRTTFDMGRSPVVSDLKVERCSSHSAKVTWKTDIVSTSEVQCREKSGSTEFKKSVTNKELDTDHQVFLNGLKAGTEYEIKVVSAYRSSSLAVSGTLSFRTPNVPPPAVTSVSHPEQDKWEKEDDLEMFLTPPVPLQGYCYKLDHRPDTVPAPPDAVYTESKQVNIAAVPQGEWYFHVVGVDDAGNLGVEAAHYKVLIDTEALPPSKVTSSTHPDPEKWVANPTPVIAWDVPKDLSGVLGFYVKADHHPDTVPGPGRGDFIRENRITLGPLEDDVWYVHIATKDSVGNEGTHASHYPIRIDTKAQAPALSSTTHPDGGTWYSNKKAEIILLPPHELSGVDGFYYVINQEPQTLPTPEDARWTKKAKITADHLKDGIWYVHVRTKDRADNLSPQASHFKVCVDTLAHPPLITSPTHPDRERWYQERRVVLDWEDPLEDSGIEGYYYNIDRHPDTMPDAKTSLFTNQRTLSFELTEDGTWYFHITTKDKAGNIASKAAHFHLRVDTAVEKPFISSATHPNEGQWYSKTKAVFKFSPPTDLSGIAGYYYTFSEDPSAKPAPTGSSYTEKGEVSLEVPRDGVHFLSVICQDKAGNVSSEPAVYRVQLDTGVEAPQLSSSSHPDPQAWYSTRRVELSWKNPADLSGVEGYYFLFNREENWMPNLKDMTWTTAKTTVFNLPEDGVWYAHVCAKDRAGNFGAVAHHKVQVDSHAAIPTVKSSTHPVNRWVKSAAPKLTWDAPQELSGVEGFYALIDTHPHTIPDAANGEWVTRTFMSIPELKDGKWFFHLSAKDKAGNISKEAAHYPIWIDTTAPKSKMNPLSPVLDRTQLPINWDATDASGEVTAHDVQVKTGAGPWQDWLVNVTQKNAVFQGQDGQRYAFRCRSKDSAGNVEEYPDEMVAVTIDISPPGAVTQLKATPLAGGDIELKWTPVEDKVSGTQFYRVYRWLEGQKPKLISADGEVREVTFVDKGTDLQENVVHYYSVHAVDGMKNEQNEGNATAACLSDATAGIPIITSPTHSSDDWSSNPSPVLTWSAPPDATGIVGYYYALDLSSNTKLTEDKGTFINKTRMELPKLQSGMWYFHLIAKDRAGNLSGETAHYRLKIDVQKPEPPHVSSTSHPDGKRWYSTREIEYKISFSPKLSGPDCYYYAFDQSPETVPQPDGVQRTMLDKLTFKATDPGVWYLHVVARDRAGNLSRPNHFPVLISGPEMPPPVVSSPTHPHEEEAANDQSPSFVWEDRHDGSYKPAGYVYKLSAKADDKLTPQDAFTTEHSVQLKGVEQGTWYFHVGAVPKKGEVGTLKTVRRIVIDRLGKVHGTFLQKDGKSPVVGTKVELAQGEKVVLSAVTDAAGRFHFRNLPEAKYELRLYSDQFPVLRVKDVNVMASEGAMDTVLTEDMGILPNPPQPGPIRFYYFLKEDCTVTIEIFDSSETLVEKITEKKEGGAYNTTIWDAAKMQTGEYVCKLSAQSALKNTMSRFAVKKFSIEKPVGELEPEPVA